MSAVGASFIPASTLVAGPMTTAPRSVNCQASSEACSQSSSTMSTRTPSRLAMIPS